LGRLLGIPAFIGLSGDEFDKGHQRAVSTERRKVSPEAKLQARELTVKKMRGLDVSQSEDPWAAVKTRLNLYMSEIQDRFEGRVIKRGDKSVRFDGQLLNSALPPFKQIVATCRLNPKEMDILEKELAVIVNK
jgi:hypothetical protein